MAAGQGLGGGFPLMTPGNPFQNITRLILMGGGAGRFAGRLAERRPEGFFGQLAERRPEGFVARSMDGRSQPGQEEEEPAFRPVDLTSQQIGQYAASQGVSPQVMSNFMAGVPGEWQPFIAGQFDQNAYQNKLREHWYNQWRNMMAQAYGNSAMNLQNMMGLFG